MLHERRILWAGPVFRWNLMVEAFLSRCIRDYIFVSEGRLESVSTRRCSCVVRVESKRDVQKVAEALEEAYADGKPFDLIVTFYGGNLRRRDSEARGSGDNAFAVRLLSRLRASPSDCDGLNVPVVVFGSKTRRWDIRKTKVMKLGAFQYTSTIPELLQSLNVLRDTVPMTEFARSKVAERKKQKS